MASDKITIEYTGADVVVFPARAGMNRLAGHRGSAPGCVPRAGCW